MDPRKGPAAARPVVVGEVLYDVFPDGREVLGGAPFNVAWNLRGLGLDPVMIARVGRDPRGDRVLAAMEAWGLDRSGMQRDPARPTGVVRVELVDGAPRYEIVPDQAYDALDGPEAERAARRIRASTTYRGTLCARSPAGRTAIAWMQTRLGAAVFLDVNLRAPWWDPQRVREALDAASIAKLNDEELDAIGRSGDDPDAAARELLRRHHLDAVIVTRGAAGATWTDADGVRTVDAPRPEAVVDTVGAGDAFAAVAILGRERGWRPTRILRRAAEFAAAACTWRGATTDDPAPYRAARERWTARDHEEDPRD